MPDEELLQDVRQLVNRFESRAELFEEDSTPQRLAKQCADDVQEVYDDHAE